VQKEVEVKTNKQDADSKSVEFESLSTLEIETRARHLEIKTQLAEAMEAHEFWCDVNDAQPFQDLIRDFEDTIQRCRVDLENAKSEEIKTLQADIRARKDILLFFEKGRSPQRVMDLRKKLQEFEQGNGLLLQAAPRRKATPKGEEAGE